MKYGHFSKEIIKFSRWIEHFIRNRNRIGAAHFIFVYKKRSDMMYSIRWGLSLLLVLSVTLVGAQNTDEEEEFGTIFGNNFSSGGYGAPELKMGPVNNENSLFMGGRGGWIIGHKFVIGGGGFGLVTKNTFMEDPANKPSGLPADSTRSIKIDMGYGGVLLEYIVLPKKAIHLSIPVLIGAGGTSLGAETYVNQGNDYSEEWATYDFIESSGFFVLEPGLYLELNMTRFFRLTFGGTYRYISGASLQRLSNSDLSGYTVNLALKFGGF
jgi:hypothetical protein